MADARSVGSRRGGGAPRYRTVAAGAEVDETLFGGGGTARSSRGAATGRSAGRGSTLRASGRRVATPEAPLAVASVLSTAELRRIKTSTVIKTREDVERERREEQERKDAQRVASKARKAHMLELEAKRLKNKKLTVLEQEEKEAKEARRNLSQFQRDEALDDVKTMTRKLRYAETVAVRDRQVAEKIERVRAAKEAERVRDLEMELARLKTIKMHRDRETSLRRKLVDDRSAIEAQIEYNKKQKEAAREAIRQEQREKKVAMEKQAQEEKEEMIRQEELQREHLAAVLAANEQAIAIKKKRKEDEIEEDRKIMEYLKKEDEKRQRREEEEEAIKAQREAEITRLRAMQEKMADKDAEMDALRAKRAFEAGERKLRERLLEEARVRAERQEEMMRAREIQRRDIEATVVAEARRQRVEFAKNRNAGAEEAARILKEEEETLSKNHAHKRDIIKMIEVREAERKEARKVYLKRGEGAQKAIVDELARIREIRDRKVGELLEAGVPERYTVELAKYDPEDALRKDYRLGGKIPTIS